MLYLTKGDLLHAPAEALVNTVNTVGVMGKGIALQFKETFPANYREYVKVCKHKELFTGKLLAVRDTNLLLGKKLIINFPTKVHWRYPSKYDYIEKGLLALRELLEKENVKSVAIPPLGCGQGGLDWNKVRPMIESHLKDVFIDIYLFEPDDRIKEILQKNGTIKEQS